MPLNICYCSGSLKRTRAAKIYRCVRCSRLYILEDKTPAGDLLFTLLVPWKQFPRRLTADERERHEKICPRCGSPTTINWVTNRYECDEKLCQYGWYDSTLGIPRVLVELNHRRRELIKELASTLKGSEEEEIVLIGLIEVTQEIDKIRVDYL